MTTAHPRTPLDQHTQSDQFDPVEQLALFDIWPGGSSAKTSHRAGSANHQDDSKETDHV